MPKILITGGTGLVGSRLIHFLKKDGHQVNVLSRTKRGLFDGVHFWNWNIAQQTMDAEAIQVDHIIHLAGAGVADKKWSDERKKEIVDSRVESTRLLNKMLKDNGVQLKSFISASAVGYYGNRKEEILKEMAPKGDGFLSDVCEIWENTVDEISQEYTASLVKLRIGIVLSTKGGAYPKLSLPVKFGVGAYLGNGKQYYPWIHIDDLCNMFIYAMSKPLKGVYNAVAPKPLSNKELVKQIAKVLNRPFIPAPGPSFIIKAAMGEMAEMLLHSQNASAQKIEQDGFKFQFREIESALKDIVKRGV